MKKKSERKFKIVARCSPGYEEQLRQSISQEFLNNYGKMLVDAELERLTAMTRGRMSEAQARVIYNYILAESESMCERLSKKATYELSSRFGIPGLTVTIESLSPYLLDPAKYKRVPETPLGCLLSGLSWLSKM